MVERYSAEKRVLTGMRSTGALHLGHYVGALEQWLQVQDQEYDCFFLVADLQALTTHSDKPGVLTQSVKEVVQDWLAVGLDPQRQNVHFVLQSQVPERYELSSMLNMIAGYAEVTRNPTLKSELKQQKNATIGFIQYPVDQVADIEMVSPTPPIPGDKLLVPVGEDQAPHLEYARVLARRFNTMYGEVFVPCEALIGRVGKLVGVDGNAKMSKSQGNAIFLGDSPAEVKKKVMGMYTDPRRTHADIPGDPDNNPVFDYHRAFNADRDEVAELEERYRLGRVGDVEVKTKLIKALNDFLDPIRQRRGHYSSGYIRDVLVYGSNRARELCQPVVQSAREKMHLVYPQADE